jgi:hypothetical protein
MVAFGWGDQWLFGEFRQPFLGPPRHVELHILVNPPDFLVIPGVALVPKPIETQSEAPTAMFGNNGIESALNNSDFSSDVG